MPKVNETWALAKSTVNYFCRLMNGAVFPVPVMNQVLPGSQEAPRFHGHIARHLDHPLRIRMRRHAGHMDLPGTKVDEE